MGLFNREQLLRKEEFKIDKVILNVNETTGEEDYIFVRQMSGADRDLFEQSILKAKYDDKGELTGYDQVMEGFRAKLAVATVCDETGTLLLKPNDYPTLAKNMTAKKLEEIINAAQKLNAISKKDKEDLVKNSAPGLQEDSASN